MPIEKPTFTEVLDESIALCRAVLEAGPGDPTVSVVAPYAAMLSVVENRFTRAATSNDVESMVEVWNDFVDLTHLISLAQSRMAIYGVGWLVRNSDHNLDDVAASLRSAILQDHVEH